MKKLTTFLSISIFALAISCSKVSDQKTTTNDPVTQTTPTVEPTVPSVDPSTQTVETGADNTTVPDYTNDESETTGSTSGSGTADSPEGSGGSSGSASIPAISTAGSLLAKTWLHSNLGNFGPHFKEWLNNNGYSDVNIPAEAGSTPGFGGFRTNKAPSGTKPIVLLVHGNGSKAQGSSADTRGWYDTYRALRNSGWNDSEIYAINYLDSTSVFNAANNDHRTSNVQKVRRMIIAVSDYVRTTRAGVKINIIGHSLGVTVSRAALSNIYNQAGTTLWDKVERFISIAAGNHGLMACGYIGPYYYYYHYGFLPTCSAGTGFALPVPHKVLFSVVYPITDVSDVTLDDSLILTNSYSLFNPTGYFKTNAFVNTSYMIGKINNADKQFRSTGPASNIKAYVILSQLDELIGVKGTTFGLRWWSAKLNGAKGTAMFNKMGIGHFGAKSKTTEVQIQMLTGSYSGTQTFN